MNAKTLERLAADADAMTVLATLKRLESPSDRAGMARFGITVDKALGVSVLTLRQLGRPLKGRQDLALALWDSEVHEARILATIVADPGAMQSELADRWAEEIDSWDLCDQFCNNLIARTDFAWDKVFLWCRDERTFKRRAGFSLMAALAVHDKQAPPERFQSCLLEIAAAAGDERNYVKKAVNWALRQIGKRNAALHGPALALARDLTQSQLKGARWVGRDAARELDSDKVREKLGLSLSG